MPVFSSSLERSLKETLTAIVNDKHSGFKTFHDKWMQVRNMEDQWYDDQEYAGPGIVPQVDEGNELPASTITEGTTWRYTAVKYGQKLIITQEALDDNKYPRIIMAAKRLKRSMFKTVEYNTADVLGRGWNPAYTFGNGQPLFSNAHPLPGGGTFSNTLATPMTPSRAALIAVRSALYKQAGHDGTIEPLNMKKVVCPTEQHAVWAGVIRSSYAPEPGAFNEINVVNRDYGVELVAIPYWRNTETNWCVVTDVEEGVKMLWRRRPRSMEWKDNDMELKKFGISARWATGVSDPRYVYGSQS